MKAMLFAAGLGTRLYPLTADRPKALVEIGGVSLLEMAVRKLQSHGVDQILVNIHHFADKMRAFLEEKGYFGGIVTISDESQKVLETGGGLKNAARFFENGAPFILYNVDVLTDLDLADFYQKHLDSGALASLAVRDRVSSRYLLFDEENQLCGWENVKNEIIRMARVGKGSLTRKAFSGIHIINPEFLGMIKQEGVFSIIETYLDLAADHRIIGIAHNDSFWLDIGKPESLEIAVKMSEDGLLGSLL